MKILVSISFYTPYISGLTTCAKNYAEGLAQKGHDVTVLAAQHDKNLSHTEVISHVTVHRIPYLFRFHKGFFMPKFLHTAWSFIAKSDVLVINLPQFEGCLLACIGWILRKKIITIYHCEVVLPKGVLALCIESALMLSHLLTVLLSDRIVTYTKDYAQSTTLLPLFSQKCTYILPPIHPPIVDKETEKKLRKSIPSGAVVIGVAARISSEKGVEYLLEAIPHLQTLLKKPVIVLIAGPKNPVGESAYWKKLHPLLEKYKDALIFLGGLSQEKLGAFYRVLDVLVLPSLNKTEAFGIVQIEAMMLGVPVVVSNLPGVRMPTVLTGMGEKAEIKNSKDLARKIHMVVSHKEKYQRNDKILTALFSYSKAIASFEALLF